MGVSSFIISKEGKTESQISLHAELGDRSVVWGRELVQPSPVQGLVRPGLGMLVPPMSGCPVCPVPTSFPSRAGP